MLTSRTSVPLLSGLHDHKRIQDTRCHSSWRCRASPERMQRHASAAATKGEAAEARVSSSRLIEQFSLARESEESAREAAGELLQLLAGASLVVAVCLELGAVSRHMQAVQAAAASQQQQQQVHGSYQLVAVAPPAPQPQSGVDYVLQRGSVWALLFVLVCNALLGRLRQSRPLAAEQLAGDLATAGQLGATQLVVSQQAGALTAARQELSKLQVKSRVTSRDLRTSLRQVQADSAKQSETLVALAVGAEQQSKQLEDFQALLEAMQVVSSKQFALLLRALPQIQQHGQSQPPPAAQSSPAMQQRQSQPQNSSVSATATQTVSAAEAQQLGRPAARLPQRPGTTQHAAGTDTSNGLPGTANGHPSALPAHSAFHDVRP